VSGDVRSSQRDALALLTAAVEATGGYDQAGELTPEALAAWDALVEQLIDPEADTNWPRVTVALAMVAARGLVNTTGSPEAAAKAVQKLGYLAVNRQAST